MTVQIEMSTADVEAAASAVGTVAEAVLASHHAEHVGALAPALPGSQSAEAALRLRGVWSAQARRWSSDAAAQRDRVLASVRAAVRTDEAVAESFARITGHLGAVHP
ncbi:hypothetical protein [Cellulomonas sp. ES6]|uniref:hypothetical protein n=1 Tax=Cellulomonas sp. ES6 TaxID=3039384 RepID=UPI0024B812F8|nr:hypothetical protein [Cellulomonas sp. ES6]WHP16039.1 hypothetical protein P9841_10320 [Cellulomonas sp. ES6]